MDELAPHSRGHSDRLARYARWTAEELGLSEGEVEATALAAFFHDVGMIHVPTDILLKPGRLTEEEYELIRNHASIGEQLAAPLQAAEPIAQIVGGHHERWDGMGYPRGLKGEAIPLGARILAAVDLFDAKTTGRPGRPPLGLGRALEELQKASGSHLDPQVVHALVAAWAKHRQAAPRGLPVSPCWEIKQLPAHVCGGCPNRVADPVRCWEEPAKLCTRHGDECETCVVYSAALLSTVGETAGSRG
jgi:HD-GYP domain-containing protein (c-di-GMP phosphodiesterase class II)